ncbi:NUDIX hydrolase [Hahella aquimaris]|uniref:NUDIX hydrolase n=1 Tax=Hahella sp. HNIBRBA332 TaxID=3015983 RepID=UPI00273BDE1D|nr:NUDIX hydrolase [Hahella sp. HNIBRBA332]WLQ13422.1 NUDIX hydrolase [Hahella sp. HNIBRBA332]
MAVWAIIEYKAELLFVQRSARTTRAGQWCFPGGGVKHGETPEAACVREVQEETGLQVKVQRLVAQVGGEYYFICALEALPPVVQLKQNECVNHAWVTPQRLPRLGTIMNFRVVAPLLRKLGYDVKLGAADEEP